MTLSQSEFTENILERFQMKESKAQNTPMVTRQMKNKENKNPERLKESFTTPSKAPYREAIGCLLYLARATRPDIAFAVNYLSRRQKDPKESDWKDVKRIFRYLRGTTEMGLTFRAKEEQLEAYADASFKDCEDSTSTGGYIIKLYGNAVSWRSYKQSHISLSTCQAEYLAMSEACQEIVSLDKAIRDITGKTFYPVTIWCDNKSTGASTQMDGSHRLKNFDDELSKIQRKLEERELTGNKRHIAETHGDYIKSYSLELETEEPRPEEEGVLE
ncbi:uncharacterized protein [Linepithema humile]|uniref:uncharacterized protein n=1 Tax=Linepithema humile TaxID=83485 RepID=UPI00351DCABC